MATQRYISTSFWDDEWIGGLDPSEKLLYLYLMTNPETNIAGIYKLSMRRMCFDTGFNTDTVGHILGKFKAAGKAFFFQEYIIIPTWPKHQRWETRNGIRLGIEAVLKHLPGEIVNFAYEHGYKYPRTWDVDTKNPPRTPQEPPNYSNNLDLDSDLDLEREEREETARASVSLGTLRDEEHFEIASYWFKRFNQVTAKTTMPSDVDNKLAREFLDSLGGDKKTAISCIDYYFDNWQSVWFAHDKQGKPSFTFRSFKNNVQEIISKLSTPKKNEPKSWSTAAPDIPDNELASNDEIAAAFARLGGICALKTS